MTEYVRNVLWTGGWDSTFRVLYLTIVKKDVVQPYYIYNESRRSNKIELEVMKTIINKAHKQFPYTKDLLRQVVVVNRESIVESSLNNYSKMHQRLTSISYLGDQYVYLANFAEQYKLDKIELSIHIDDKAYDFIKNDIEEFEYSHYKLKEHLSNGDLYLFKHFSFPILELSKLEMETISKENKFEKLMEKTWFCHKPTKNSKPCGKCGPCRYTLEEGLGRRLPFIVRVEIAIKKSIPVKLKNSLKKVVRN